MNSIVPMGFVYDIELLKNGVVIERETVRNLMPMEGINHAIAVAVKGAAQNTTWYLGLYQNNYTPLLTDVALTFPTLAGENVGYAEATRVEWVEGTVTGGTVSNVLSRAEFTSTATATIYGGFMSSAPAKGATSGVLLSAVRFTSPKTFEEGSVLRVTAGLTFTSL